MNAACARRGPLRLLPPTVLPLLVACQALTTTTTAADGDLAGSTLLLDPPNIAANGPQLSQATFFARTGRGASVVPKGGKVAFSAAGCTVAPATSDVDASGVATAQISGCDEGQHVVTVSVVGTNVAPAATSSLKAYYPADAAGTAVAVGTSLNIEVITGYGFAGNIRFISSDALATLPQGVAMKISDHGLLMLVGGVTLRTPGIQTVEAQDGISGRTLVRLVFEVVGPSDAAGGLAIRALAPAVAGEPVPVLVDVRDASGDRMLNFVGSLTLTVTDPRAQVPAARTVMPADSGTVLFTNVILLGAGSQTITVADGHGATANLAVNVAVGPLSGTASTLTRVGQAAVPANGTATATLLFTGVDAYSNPVPGAHVTFTASGSNNTLTPTVGVTGADGTVSLTIASTTPEIKTVFAQVGSVLPSISVTFN